MDARQIQGMLREALTTPDRKRKRQLLETLSREDPENADVQAAQTELGSMYHEGKEGAPYDPARAEELYRNPARHNNSNALLGIALIHYKKGNPDSLSLFCQTWIAGGTGSEAAVSRLEELRIAGAKNVAFLQILDGEIEKHLNLLLKRLNEWKDPNGSLLFAMALYHIYELGGHDSGNLEKAYDLLKEAEEKGNALVRIYLKRTAFAHMDNPEASARMKDARKDYSWKPLPEVDEDVEDSGEDSYMEPKKSSLYSVFNMPSRITGPYNHTYHRVSFGVGSAEYMSDVDFDTVTIRDEDISLGIMGGYNANTSAGKFWW